MTKRTVNPLIADDSLYARYNCLLTQKKQDETIEIVFKQDDVEAPKGWSQSAVDMMAQKYFRRAGVPDKVVPVREKGVPVWLQRRVPAEDATFGGETSFRQTAVRLAGAWTYHGWKAGHFTDDKGNKNEELAQDFYETMFRLLFEQKGAPNSPQWFNTGLNWAYGIESFSKGHYRVDPKTGKSVRLDEAYAFPQGAACYIIRWEDNLVDDEGIYDSIHTEASLFKEGSGVGSNFSNIRGAEEGLSNGGVSSGLLSFLRAGDVSAGSIQSGGTTRRSAKMVIVDADHPEILEFIEWKVNEEKKVASLVTGSTVLRMVLKDLLSAGNPREIRRRAKRLGVPDVLLQNVLEAKRQGYKYDIEQFDTDFRNEAYNTVSGQNSNNSIMATDAFMQAALSGEMWELVERTTGKVRKSIRADELFDKIAYAAWSCADPALLYYDTMNRWHTHPYYGPIRATNPCAEIGQPDNSACNLASINLLKYYNPSLPGRFDWDMFKKDIRRWTRVLEITNFMGSSPTQAISEYVFNYRTIGLGFANLGALLMTLGLPYDSDAGRALASRIASVLTAQAYIESALMAKELGAFPGYAKDSGEMIAVLERHRSFSLTPAADGWDEAIALGKQFGFRNAFATSVAPTGTIGFLMGCDTTGIEPDYALVKYKKVVGGNTIKIINQSVPQALRNLGYDEDEVISITGHVMAYNTVEGSIIKDEHKDVFACAVDGDPEHSIHYMGHVRMVAAVQRFISQSISKTINMPEDCTVQDVKDVYIEGWKMGCKGISLYRSKSKLASALSSGPEEEETRDDKPLWWGERRHLPARRRGERQKARVGQLKIYVSPGEYEDGTLGEIFVDTHKEGATLRGLLNAFSSAVSLGLQYGVPLSKYVDNFSFTQFAPNGMVTNHANIKSATSIVDYIARHLGVEYLQRDDLAHIPPQREVAQVQEAVEESLPAVKDGFTGDVCAECGESKMVRNGACQKCTVCGATTGCS